MDHECLVATHLPPPPPEQCKKDMEAALAAWQEQLRVWVGVVRLGAQGRPNWSLL